MTSFGQIQLKISGLAGVSSHCPECFPITLLLNTHGTLPVDEVYLAFSRDKLLAYTLHRGLDPFLGVFTGVFAFFLYEIHPRTARHEEDTLIGLLRWKHRRFQEKRRADLLALNHPWQPKRIPNRLYFLSRSSCTIDITPSKISRWPFPSSISCLFDLASATPITTPRRKLSNPTRDSSVQTIVAICEAYKDCSACKFAEGAAPNSEVNWIAGEGSCRRTEFGWDASVRVGRRGVVAGRVACIYSPYHVSGSNISFLNERAAPNFQLCLSVSLTQGSGPQRIA